MHHLSIDLETFSSVDIKKAGLYKYVQSPDFEVLLFGYSWDGQPVQVLDLAQGQKIQTGLINALFDPNVLKQAYNASFEWYCLSKLVKQYLPLNQWHCTMLHGLYCGYPGFLAGIGEALGIPEDKRKMGIGRSLITTFCKPCKPTKSNGNRTRTLPHHEPDKWQLFRQYNAQDVVTEMEVERRLSSFPVPEAQQKLWELDQITNLRGVKVDLDLIAGALYCDEITAAELKAEAVRISGLDNPKSVAQLSKWLEKETGEEINNLQKGTVKELIKTVDSDAARRMLEIRQEISKTSTKKYDAMQTAVCNDGRVRGLLQFYGANRTGRYAGRIIQCQNLPKNHLKGIDLARDVVKARKLDSIKLIWGGVPDTLSQLIRTAFVPKEGHIFMVADFSAIEARVIAWLAGETWVMKAFATHGKIYEATASQMFGVPIEKIVKGQPEYELRQKGKVATLACGYQGSVGALKKMGADKMGLSDDELQNIVQRWRNANRRIVDLWYKVERAAIETVTTGRPTGVNGLLFAREIDRANGQDFLTITLPSSRKLFYARPHMAREDGGFKDSIHYWGVNQTSRKWETSPTYGGKLVENITQAIARDCLTEALTRLEAAGYQVVFHVHDEAIIEVPIGADDLNRACAIMGEPIPWAPGLLLRADGFKTEFYRKED
jgi:DNA polymerase